MSESASSSFWREGAKPVVWECEGDPEFTMSEGDRTQRGTKITLYLDDESKEFATSYKVNELLNKYCKFMPVPIAFGKEQKWEENKYVDTDEDKIINNSEPIWNKKPSELTSEDYMNFYRELYPMQDDPLFYIHLNVDYPFNLTGVLYFPKVKKNIDPHRDKIQLYCNQVFVTDSVEGVVPEYMMLLRGVLDSPDIPLNVSRSYLQADGNVKKISSHISKKVAEKLEQMYKNDKDEFIKKWDDLSIFIKYGMISDEKFYDRMSKVCQLKNTEGNYFTFEEYKAKIEAIQTDKNKKVVYLYANNTDEQFSYIKAAKDKGYDVLLMDGILDNHFIQTLEHKFTDAKFARIDSETIEKLIEKDEVIPSKLSAEETEKIKTLVEAIVDKAKFTVQPESLEQNAKPLTITQNEFMRRMKEMAEMGGGGMASFYGEMPEHYNLVVNVNHPIISQILGESDTEKQTQSLSQLKDLALLGQGLLKGEALDNFISRSIEIIK